MAGSFAATPSWLDNLLNEVFSEPCTNLPGCREKDVLCLDCCNIFCTRCVHHHNPLHRRHIKIHDFLESLTGLHRELYELDENLRRLEEEVHLNPDSFQVPIPPADTFLRILEEGESSRGRNNQSDFARVGSSTGLHPAASPDEVGVSEPPRPVRARNRRKMTVPVRFNRS